MSFDTFCLWFLAIAAVGYFLDKLGDAAKDIAKARLLEAETASRKEAMNGPQEHHGGPEAVREVPRYRRRPGEDPPSASGWRV